MAAVAAISLALLATSSGLAATDGVRDTTPPDIGNVPPCHIEAIPPGTTTRVFALCPAPIVESVNPAITVPDSMQAESAEDAVRNDIHRIQWKTGNRILLDLYNVGLRPGMHHMTWEVADASGNAATTTQVILISDTKAPLFRPAPASAVTVEATAPSTQITADMAGITAVDEAGSAVILKPSVEEIKVGETEAVLWTARDAAGNTSRIRQDVTVQDTTPPAIIPADPPDIVLETTGTHLDITAVMAGIEGKDGGTLNPEVRASPTRLNIGPNTVTWTAHDDAELASSPVTQSITVVPKFAIVSSSISNYGINLVFSQDVDPSTVSGIRAAKLDGSRVIDASPAISVSEKTVRIDPKRNPTFPSPGFHLDTFCEPRGITYDCYKINGQWIITLPGSVASVHGFSLHDGSQPSFGACRAQVSDATAAVEGCHTPVLQSP